MGTIDGHNRTGRLVFTAATRFTRCCIFVSSPRCASAARYRTGLVDKQSYFALLAGRSTVLSDLGRKLSHLAILACLGGKIFELSCGTFASAGCHVAKQTCVRGAFGVAAAAGALCDERIDLAVVVIQLARWNGVAAVDGTCQTALIIGTIFARLVVQCVLLDVVVVLASLAEFALNVVVGAERSIPPCFADGTRTAGGGGVAGRPSLAHFAAVAGGSDTD